MRWLCGRCVSVDEDAQSHWVGEPLSWEGHRAAVLGLQDQLPIAAPQRAGAVCEWDVGRQPPS
eukprot:3761433-Lingulodinium_polyedra.AAC.1